MLSALLHLFAKEPGAPLTSRALSASRSVGLALCVAALPAVLAALLNVLAPLLDDLQYSS